MRSHKTPPFPQNCSDGRIQLSTKTQSEPELEVWDPPFERWMKLADDLLREDRASRSRTIDRPWRAIVQN